MFRLPFVHRLPRTPAIFASIPILVRELGELHCKATPFQSCRRSNDESVSPVLRHCDCCAASHFKALDAKLARSSFIHHAVRVLVISMFLNMFQKKKTILTPSVCRDLHGIICPFLRDALVLFLPNVCSITVFLELLIPSLTVLLEL